MRLGIIGCGNMGSAIAKGVISEKILPFNNIYVSDSYVAKTKELNKRFGIRLGTNEEIAKKCEIIIIAVKPQDFKALASSISELLSKSTHIVSIMAGVSVKKIETLIGKKVAITRAMPNLAALAGKSITCLCHGKYVRTKTSIQKIFSSIGEVLEVDEKHMDAITAVSGSGPAYLFYLAECLRDAAIKVGLKKEDASKLADQTLIGSGALLDLLKTSPEALRAQITSKKGTTEAALRILKNSNFKESIEKAVKAAKQRAAELSKGA